MLATSTGKSRCAPKTNARKKPSHKVTWATVRDLLLALEGVQESTFYRMPAMMVSLLFHQSPSIHRLVCC